MASLKHDRGLHQYLKWVMFQPAHQVSEGPGVVELKARSAHGLWKQGWRPHVCALDLDKT